MSVTKLIKQKRIPILLSILAVLIVSSLVIVDATRKKQSTQAEAQGPSTVTGLVTNEVTGDPVSEAKVEAKMAAGPNFRSGKSVAKTTTDENGLYVLRFEPAGTIHHNLNVSKPKYNSFSVHFLAIPDETETIDVLLVPK